MQPDESDSLLVITAQNGDKKALGELILRIQPKIYALALRFLWHPEDADDATQEILIKIITHLSTFKHESKFSTWVYKIASNTLFALKKKRMEMTELSFDTFVDDLQDGLDNTGYSYYINYLTGNSSNNNHPATEGRLLEEVKVGCTLAMLLCLDRKHRLAYILGEIMEFDHNDAAEILEISQVTYRKQLSRARNQIIEFTQLHCGLINTDNLCHCSKRVVKAIQLQRVDPQNLIFSTANTTTQDFYKVTKEIESIEATRRIASAYQSNTLPTSKTDLHLWLKAHLGSMYKDTPFDSPH